jgi:hypothetical protein
VPLCWFAGCHRNHCNAIGVLLGTNDPATIMGVSTSQDTVATSALCSVIRVLDYLFNIGGRKSMLRNLIDCLISPDKVEPRHQVPLANCHPLHYRGFGRRMLTNFEGSRSSGQLRKGEVQAFCLQDQLRHDFRDSLRPNLPIATRGGPVL